MAIPRYGKEYEYPPDREDIEEAVDEDIISSEAMVAEAEGKDFEEVTERAIEKQIALRKEREPEPEPEPIEEPPPEPKRKLGTGEKIYLYISTAPGTYALAETTFDSRIEAGQWAEENYAGTEYQTMNQAEVDTYMAKMQKRQEQVEGFKEDIKDIGVGVKKVAVAGARRTGRGLVSAGRAFTAASGDVAQQAGMTRRQIEPQVRKAWTGQPQQGYQPPPPPYQPGGMMPTPSEYAKRPPQPPPEEPTHTRYGRPLRPLQTPRQRPPPQQPQQRPRMGMQGPPRQKSYFHIPAGGPFQKRQFDIPAEGPFQRRVSIPRGEPPKSGFRPRGQAAFQTKRFDFSGGLHMVSPHYVGGGRPGFGRRPPPQQPQPQQQPKPIPTLKKKRKPKKKLKKTIKKKKPTYKKIKKGKKITTRRPKKKTIKKRGKKK